jgi:hypothetical protein
VDNLLNIADFIWRYVLAPLATAGVVVLVALHRKAIWPIARNTLAQAIRVRVAFVIMALYLLVAVALPFIVRGDGTLPGLLRVIASWSLMAAGTLLGLLTLTLSTTTLWTEVRDKQIFVLESKPIRRWHVLVGKLLGILLVNAALLAVMGLVTWGSVHYLASRTQWRGKTWTDRDRRNAREQVLTARRVVAPDPVPESEVEDFVDRNLELAIRRLEREGKAPRGNPEEAQAKARQFLREQFLNLANAVPPFYGHTWRFSGLTTPRRKDIEITIRFKFFSSERASEEAVRVRWLFGAPRGQLPPGQRHQVYELYNTYRPDEVHELQVPADAVDKDGVMLVRLENNLDPRRPVLIFSGKDAIQALLPAGGFGPNLARGLLVIFVEVLFLAVLGLFCSTFLDFPVAPVIALSILLLIHLSATAQAEFEKGFSFDQSKQSGTAQVVEHVARFVSAAVHRILPPLDRFATSPLVSSGEEVSWGLVYRAYCWIGLFYGGLLLLVGASIFERRELALASR